MSFEPAPVFTDIFADDIFNGQGLLVPQSPGSPDFTARPANTADPLDLQREDPLATQVWRMYARTKANLPHAQRMENLSWRMMALALKKKREDQDNQLEQQVEPQPDPEDQRGRRIDKGKAPVRVVGFDGTNQDGVDDEQ
jgi:GATA-binding protein, other eukaryote